MSGLVIFTSNRMEALAERLAQLVRRPLASPLTPEIVVVQSRGMERWISMSLARLNGICANVAFPFPNAFLQDMFQRLRPEAGASEAFEPEVLAFRLMQLLPRRLQEPDFEPLRDFLRNDPFQLKLYQLCRRLADLFDQYSVFRADMLLHWEEGLAAEPDPVHRWQARLWRELVSTAAGAHRARFWKESLAALDARSAGEHPLPERVSLFGISYLPPSHLQCIDRLSRRMRVNLFLLNPCREYWADILSERDVQRLERRQPRVAEATEDYHLERGNRLLASLGGLGRQFFDLTAELGAVQEDTFEDPGQNSLLCRLQSDILNLRDRAAHPRPAGRIDGSVRIHSCHSPMREIEVLHDQLLAMFEEDPGLLPADIVVMTPDIGAYAPYISAVFGSQDSDERHIPFSIADRGDAGASQLETALASLLSLKGSRLGAAEVLRLLEFGPVRRRFSIADADLPVLERWVRETGIRWGADENDRLRLGLPGAAENTWKAGIERLLLGYAMPSDGVRLFNGILPYDAIEGGEARGLGNLLEYLERVFALARRLEEPRTLHPWRELLRGLLADFWVAEDEWEPEIRRVVRMIDELGALEASAGFSRPVSVEVVRSFLKERLEGDRLGRGFLAGGVTFCAMLPMRTIPFKVVCLIGLNYDAFPRDHRPLAFDLISRHPRPGDRSRRSDDKYLFLEALLSARKTLYISYVGRSIQDNAPLPPSVLVSELADELQADLRPAAGDDAAGLVTEHRLQSFARAYFQDGSGLFSYSREDFLAWAAPAQRGKALPFFRHPLAMAAEDAADWRDVSLEVLAAFLSHPSRFLLQKRLGIRLEEDSAALEESEPFELTPLTRYRIGSTLLEDCLAGRDPMSLLPAFRAAGELPHDRVGEHLFSRLAGEVRSFAARAKALLPQMEAAPFEGLLEIGGFRLAGRINGRSASGVVRIRYADITAADVIHCWLRHVFLEAGGGNAAGARSLLIGRDAAWGLRPVADSRNVLADLLDLYWDGLAAPIPFFPAAALAYARKLLAAGGSPTLALASAQRSWIGREPFPGESDDPYHRLCHGHGGPLGADFERLAVRVFEPFFQHADPIPF